MSTSNVETVHRFWETHNRGDLEALKGFVAPGAVTTDRARNLTFHGPAGFVTFKQGFFRAFPDLLSTMQQVVDAGDTVVCQEIADGTNNGPFGPMPPTGRRLHLPVCVVFRFDADGLIETADFYWDQFTLLTQLGHAEAAA
ncbi:MAG: ester cyclase [Actinomycetota bacterium]